MNKLILQKLFLRALKALNKRPFIISRSNFIGHGHYGGIWDGDITSNWDTLRWTIPCIFQYNHLMLI